MPAVKFMDDHAVLHAVSDHVLMFVRRYVMLGSCRCQHICVPSRSWLPPLSCQPARLLASCLGVQEAGKCGVAGEMFWELLGLQLSLR